MSNAFIALVIGLAFGGWVYSKVQRTTGGNTQSSLTVAAIAGVFGFIVGLLLLRLIPS